MNTTRVGVFTLILTVVCLGLVGTAIAGIASEPDNAGVESSHEFTITTLDISPVIEGEQLDVTVEIENEGDSEGEETVELDVPGLGSDETQLSLDPNESTTIELSVDTEIEDAAGSPYTATVTAGASEISESAVVNLPTLGTAPPQDTTGDGFFDDVDGDGTLTIADVQLLFDSYTAGEMGEHAWAYNFAGFTQNQVTIFDVQALFRQYLADRPRFDVELTSVPDEVEAGEAIDVEYQIENTGGSAGTQDIVFEVDGNQQGIEEDIELEPGDTFSETFIYTTDSGDVPEVSVTVSTATDSETSTVTVAEVEPPTFEVELTDVPEEVMAGEDIEVEYEIENTGDQTDTQDIVFEIDGDQQGIQEDVELSPGDTFSETFTYTTDSEDVPGVAVTVSSETDSDTGSVTVMGADDFDIRGTLSNETADIGETVTVDYTVVSETGEEQTIGGYVLEIEWDADILEFQSISGGAFGEPFETNAENGWVRALDSGNDEQTPLEPMVEIEFEVVGEGTSPIEFVPGENEIVSPAPGSTAYTTRFVDGTAGTTDASS